ADTLDWPFCVFNYTGAVKKRRIARRLELKTVSVGERRQSAEGRGRLGQALAQGVDHLGENPRGGVAEFLLGGSGDARDNFTGLVAERSDGGEHPLIGNIFEAAAEILGGLLANTCVQAAYLRLLGLSHRFPGLEQGTETSLHFLIVFSDACLQRAAHGGLKAAEKALLLRGEFLSQIGLR